MDIPSDAFKNFQKTYFLKAMESPAWQELPKELQEVYALCYGASLPDDWMCGEYCSAKLLGISPFEARRRVRMARSLLLELDPTLGTRRQRQSILKESASVEADAEEAHTQHPHRPDQKKLWRSIAAQPFWEQIPKKMRSVAEAYYGFDLPGDETRTLAGAAEYTGMKLNTASGYLTIAKQYCKNFDPNLPFTKIEAKPPPFLHGMPRSEITRQMWEKRRKKEKKTWRIIEKAPWWKKISPRKQQIIAVYMGLDLPEDAIRTLNEAAKFLGTTRDNIAVQYGHAKTFCKYFDPTLPWNVKTAQPPSSRRILHEQEKEVVRGIIGTALWQKFTDHERHVVSCYYGLDLPDEQIRGLKNSAQMLDISYSSISTVIRRVKSFIKHADSSAPFPVNARNMPMSRTRLPQEKALFIALSETSLWEQLSPMFRRVIMCRYGFDLPGEETRTFQKTAAAQRMTSGSSRTIVWMAKAILKRHDPSLPFNVKPMEEKEETALKLSLLQRFKRELFAREDLGDEDVERYTASLREVSNKENSIEREPAQWALFLAGMRDVLHVAFAWHGRLARFNGSFDALDYIQEGGIGLWSTLSDFEGSTRKELGEFARKAARDEIKLSLRRSGVSVSVGSEFTALLRKLSRAWETFKKYSGSDPSFDELVRAMGEPREVVSAVLDHARISIVPSRSLDAPAFHSKEDSSPPLVEVTADEKVLPPEEIIEQQAWEIRERWLAESAEKALRNSLSPIEQYVLRLKYGFDTEPHTLEAIASNLRTTEASVQVVESEAIEKLRTDQKVFEAVARFVDRPRVLHGKFSLAETARITLFKKRGQSKTKPQTKEAESMAAARADMSANVSIENAREDFTNFRREDAIVDLIVNDEQTSSKPGNESASIPTETVSGEDEYVDETEEEEAGKKFFTHEHRWLVSEVRPDMLEEELSDTALPNIRELAQQGLIPARLWYRKSQKRTISRLDKQRTSALNQKRKK